MIAVKDIAYVRHTTPDLDAMEKFLIDFGLFTQSRTEDTLYMRGRGSQPFIHVTHRGPANSRQGLGFFAQSLADLEKLASATGTKVEDNLEPGGGAIVHLRDLDGFDVDVIFGGAELEPLPTRAAKIHNPAGPRQRVLEKILLDEGPSHVMRLGHVVLRVKDYAAAYEWYSTRLGFKVSDSYFNGTPDNPMMAFLHCGLGDALTDHHTIALAQVPAPPGIDHSAFEVLDIDDLQIGHYHLVKAGHTHAWGIGRHIEGSQIFDYWRDPNGTKTEHWTDGDVVNDHYTPGTKSFGEVMTGRFSNWAPVLDPSFFV